MTTNIINLEEYRQQRAKEQREIGVIRMPCPVYHRKTYSRRFSIQHYQDAPISPDAEPVRETGKTCPQVLATGSLLPF